MVAMNTIKSVWQFLNKDIQDFGITGNRVETGAEVSKASLELLLALGLLGTPLAPAGVAIASLSFVGLTRKGLNVLREKTNGKTSLEQWVAVAFPLAYVESFASLVTENLWLQDKFKSIREDLGARDSLEELGKLALNQSLIDEGMEDFPDSTLGRALNAQLANYLQKIGLEQQTIHLITGWTAWGVYPIIERLLENEEEDILLGLQMKASGAKGLRLNSKYYSIENYLEEQISPETTNPNFKALWQVFDEKFTLPDIYVPLQGQLLDEKGEPQLKRDKNGKVITNWEGEPKEKDPVDLEAWVKEQITESVSQVTFIQAGPGRGKSVFCRMFANWVRKNLHPIWTPILIRLRDIENFNTNLEEILSTAVKADFVKSDAGWLHDRNTRFLFLLDGFDELRMEGRTAGGIEKFLRQVGQYQQDCQRSELGHRFLVTGRQSALLGIVLPSKLQRVQIVLMSKKLQKWWLVQWEKLVGKEKARAFAHFLEAQACPKRVKELAQEPLLLYLLGAMCRDDKLNLAMFKGRGSTEAKVRIYQTAIDWVLTKQRPEELNLDLTGQDHKDDLKHILSEASLCITQSGREWAALSAIEGRLTKDTKAKKLLDRARQRLKEEENPLRNFLAAFYLRPVSGEGSGQGAVEFVHKSFGEFLCAERMVESLKEFTFENEKLRRGGYLVSDEGLAEEFYDLFGYGGLTTEIVEYIFSLLQLEEEQLVNLFERLQDFYLDWWEGKFIDAPPIKNWPQNTLGQLKEQGIVRGLRQVDVYTGLNVLVLLFNLHHYGQEREGLKEKLTFHPCGQPGSKEFAPERLLRIIHYSESVELHSFMQVVGYCLSGVNLSGAYLIGAYLIGAYLSNANLIGANLRNANLSNANLSGADLSSADLSSADLSSADLKNANLSGANLSSADFIRVNLSNANLICAYLSGANLIRANLRNANFRDVDLRNAYLSGAELIRADLRAVNLIRADLSNADLSGANLSSADLRAVNLSGANLRAVNLSGAELSGAYLRDANLRAVNLSGAELSGAYLIRTDLSGADLRAVNLSNADLRNTNLRATYLKNIVWNEKTTWPTVEELAKAKNVPEELLKNLTQ